MNLPKLSITRPVFIVMIFSAIITLGLVGYFRLPVDLMPKVDFPTVMVNIVYPGASAEEIETLITKPLEDTFSTLEGIDKVISSSREGVAMITVQFGLGVDINFAELKLRDKLSAIKPYLPDGIKEPIISRFSFEDIPILFCSINGKRDITYLKELLEDDIKPKIEQIPGVAGLTVFGGKEKQIRITLDKSLLLAKGISLNQITGAIAARNLNYPVGEIKGDEKITTVRIVGEFETVDDIKNMPITTLTGKIVSLKDIAKVEMLPEETDVKVKIKGNPGVMFAVYKQSGENSVKIAKKVMKKIKEINKELPKDISLTVSGDTTVNIIRNKEGVQENIIIGAILAVLVVFIFLGSFRSAIITAIALPDSIIGTFFLIWLAGFSINSITLLSLALAVGLLIDDSIVVRENIFRHLEEGKEKDPKIAAEKGTNEVALAVLATTLSVMSVFLPISFLTGVVGQFFKEFGLTVAFALAVSLFDAFTIAPMLSAYWYKRKDDKISKTKILNFFYNLCDKWNAFYKDLLQIYEIVLKWALNNKKKIISLALLLFIGSFFLLPFIGKGFMNQNSNFLIINVETYPGAPANKVEYVINRIEEFIKKEKDVESYFTITGGSMQMGSKSNEGMLFLSLKPIIKRKLKPEQITQKIKDYLVSEKLDSFAKITSSGMMGGSSDMNTPVLITVAGDDLKELQKIGLKIRDIIMETPGAIDVDTSLKPGVPELVLKIDPIKAEKLGFTTYEVGEFLRALLQGKTVSKFKKGEKEYDIVVRLDEKNRRTKDDVKNIIITNRFGKKVPLSSIVNINEASGPTEIRRENKSRVVKISARLAPGYSMSEVNNKIFSRLKKDIVLPPGFRYITGGQVEMFADLMQQMLFAILLAVIFMYMILASLYNSFIQPLYLMLALPLAVIGAFWALLVTRVTLDLYAFIGIMMVLGLVAKNGIILLDFINKKREEGMSIREAILHAAPIRLRPILMTSFAMIFGMLPIALSIGEGAKGKESMAIVVIGGLLTSTFLTLVVVPAVYEWVENKFIKRKK
ncbi:MAG: efflux RND transporter permease subunit [Candidatus Goldbacteria bacterium]|nr:efflux RND transporter permease subunit [Candidatus Goldiibacteriota bacterium]